MTRILIVEDDPDLLFLYQTALAQRHYEPVLTDTVAGAIAELEQDQFDVVILDLNIADAHGSAVIEYAQANGLDHMKIFVVTANDHWLNAIVQTGAHKVLVKPVAIRDIVALVDNVKT